MAKVSINYPHNKSLEEARDAANTFAGKLKSKLGVNYEWQGDSMLLDRQGVTGSLTLSEGAVDIQLQLGMMLTPMKGQIESEINRQLDKYLA